MHRSITLGTLVVAWLSCPGLLLVRTAMPTAIHRSELLEPVPTGGLAAGVNPPSLRWRANQRKETRYSVRLSQKPSFPDGETIAADNLSWAMFNPHRKLASGTWHWQVATRLKPDSKQVWSEIQQFRIEPGTREFVTPPVVELLAAVPREHPRIFSDRAGLESYRSHLVETERGRAWIRAGTRVRDKPLPNLEGSGPKQ